MRGQHLLLRMDFRALAIIASLMVISLLVISSYTLETGIESGEEGFFTPLVYSQMQRFFLGSVIYFLCAIFDYNKLRELAWILYAFMIATLIGVFFTDTVQGVHRWYKIPLLNIGFQPSEYAKLIVVISLSWYLERKRSQASSFSTAFFGGLIVLIPFILIFKQPDLGTSLVLLPVTMVMFYLGGVKRWIVKTMAIGGIAAFAIVLVVFLEIVSHEEAKPYATQVLKEYQYDRLDPNTHHQKAAITAIAVGGVAGKGWRKGDFTQGGWLPMPVTDSVFPAFGEEFGFFGLVLLLTLFYALVYLGFQVTAVAKDHFGRLLSAGVATYLAIHVIVNVGMMCGLMPITGVPLILVTYGGSAIFSSMAALGILQSIYIRRFMF